MVNHFGTNIHPIYKEEKQCAYNETYGSFADHFCGGNETICYVYL
jgi:hypothetical protein